MRSFHLLLPASLAFLIACKEDKEPAEGNEQPGNAAPAASITSPASGDSVREGELVRLTGEASDAEDGAEALSASWWQGETLLCGPAAVEADGSTSCDAVFAEGAVEVRLEVTDSVGASAAASTNFTVVPEDAPTLSLVAPTGRLYGGMPVVVTGVVADLQDAPAALSVSAAIEGAPEHTVSVNVEEDGSFSAEVTLPEGVWPLMVEVTDTAGNRSSGRVLLDVGAENVAPSCGIVEPFDGQYVDGANQLGISAWVDDANEGAENLAWSLSTEMGVVAEGVGGEGGEISTTLEAGLPSGVHTVTLTVVDELGAVCSAAAQIDVGTDPLITQLSPLDGSSVSGDVPVELSVLVADGETNPDELMVRWNLASGVLIGEATADGDGIARLVTDNLPSGAQDIVATVVDAHGRETSVSFSVDIDRSATGLTLAFVPEEPRTVHDLSLVFATPAVDPDGEVVTYTIEWSVDGVLMPALADRLIVPSTETAKGQTWTAAVTPWSGGVAGEVVLASVTVADTAPELIYAGLDELNPTVADTISCLADAIDPDVETISYTYSWDLDGVKVGDEASLSLDVAEKGQVVSCTVTPVAGGIPGESEVVSTTVRNAVPAMDSVNIDNLLPTEADELHCAYTASDADGDSLTPTYTWSVGGFNQLDLTGDTFPAGRATKGSSVVCSVSVHDGEAGSTTLASTAAVIQNQEPVVDSISLGPVDPEVASVLTCTATGSDADGDSLVATYAWTVNGANIGHSAETLSLVGYDQGDVVGCSVQYDDGTDQSTVTPSNFVTIVNSAPQMVSVELTPEVADTDTELVCGALAYDGDGDSLSFTYAWTINGAVSPVVSAALPASNTAKGDVVSCSVLAYDGEASSSPMASDPVVIGNSAPVIDSIAFDLGIVRTNDTLSAVVSASDADSDPVILSYQWFVNGSMVQSGASASLAGSLFEKGDAVHVEVTPFDGSASGVEASFGPIVVANTAPEVPDMSLSPVDPMELLENLVCTASGMPSDVDTGDLDAPGAVSLEWRVNGAVYGGATTTTMFPGDTVPGSELVPGDVWTCTLNVNDGTTTVSDTSNIATVEEAIVDFGLALTGDPATNAAYGVDCEFEGWGGDDRTCTNIDGWDMGTGGSPMMTFSWDEPYPVSVASVEMDFIFSLNCDLDGMDPAFNTTTDLEIWLNGNLLEVVDLPDTMCENLGSDEVPLTISLEPAEMAWLAPFGGAPNEIVIQPQAPTGLFGLNQDADNEDALIYLTYEY
jgi:hypothetical protein